MNPPNLLQNFENIQNMQKQLQSHSPISKVTGNNNNINQQQFTMNQGRMANISPQQFNNYNNQTNNFSIQQDTQLLQKNQFQGQGQTQGQQQGRGRSNSFKGQNQSFQQQNQQQQQQQNIDRSRSRTPVQYQSNFNNQQQQQNQQQFQIQHENKHNIEMKWGQQNKPQNQNQLQKQQQQQTSQQGQGYQIQGQQKERAHFYNTQGLQHYMKQDYKDPDNVKRNFQNENFRNDLSYKDGYKIGNQPDSNSLRQDGFEALRQQDPKPSTHVYSSRMKTNPYEELRKAKREKEQADQMNKGKKNNNGFLQFDPKCKYQVFFNQFAAEDEQVKKEFLLPPAQYDSRKYTVLMVAEKPSIAKSIAEALCGRNGYTSRKGACKYCMIHEFYGSIFGKNAFFKVTSVIGHIYTTDFPVSYQDWRKIDPIELFDAPTIKKESNPDSNIVEHLSKESMGSSYVVLWLDNDKEGENICYEVLSLCRPNLIREDFMQIYRAKFSSITTQDIQKAFQNLNSGPSMNESISVDARQIIDLKIGVAFSRFQTRYLVRKYQELQSKKITYGPCQTPTLAFCVARDDEIQDFRPQRFFRPIPRCYLQDGTMISVEWTKERTYDEEEALRIKEEIERIGILSCVHVENKDATRTRPEALNTIVLLKLASQQIGLGPQRAMQIAEKLYLGGYTTYPRTESTRYPASYDFEGVVNALSRNRECQGISQYANQIKSQGIQNARAGVDQGDHPPITPTNKIPQNLNKQEQTMYEMISRNFLASISRDARFYKKKISFNCGSQSFSLKGTACVDRGFIDIMPWIKVHENEIPNFQQGDQLTINQVQLHQGMTQAPDHLTESDLMNLMEKNTIGTDASMATHINNICERDYVQVIGQQRRLVPTQLGKSLFHGFQSIDYELVAPDLRSSIEKSVDKIAKGEINYNEVLNNVIELFKKKYVYFVSNITKLDVYFETKFSSIDQAIALAKGFSKCGRCKGLLKLLEKVGKLYCDKCKFMFGLPRSLNFEAAQDCICPIDGYQLILCTVNQKNNTKKISVCPLCYQKTPQIEDIKFNKYDRVTCNSCANRQCNFSMAYNEIMTCIKCKSNGKVVLDWPQGGKQTMTCNVCQYQYVLCNNGTVYKSKSRCDTCQAYIIKIELNEPERGFHDMVFEGCVFCDARYCRIIQQFPPIEEDKDKQNEEEGNSKIEKFLKYDNSKDDNKRGGIGSRGGRGGRGGGRGGSDRGNDRNSSGRGSMVQSTSSRGGGRGSRGGRGGKTDNKSENSSGRGGRGRGRGNRAEKSSTSGTGHQRSSIVGSGSKQGGYQYSNNNLSDPISILRKPIHK